jgi:hypothetical protein
VPFHTEQLKLSGLGDDEIQEAAVAVLQSMGVSSYLHGVDYSVDRFKHELDSAVAHIKRQSKIPAKVPK